MTNFYQLFTYYRLSIIVRGLWTNLSQKLWWESNFLLFSEINNSNPSPTSALILSECSHSLFDATELSATEGILTVTGRVFFRNFVYWTTDYYPVTTVASFPLWHPLFSTPCSVATLPCSRTKKERFLSTCWLSTLSPTLSRILCHHCLV